MSSSSQRIGSHRVLIVEDESILGISLENQLKRLGHAVVGNAASAADARKLFIEKQPDMVLLDIKLAQDDGIELARTLLKERRCPVIVISAYSDEQLIARAGEAGIFGYLIKPVSAELLAAQIEVCTQRFQDSEVLRMEKEQLVQTLETRKIIERAKGVYMKRLSLDEPEAHRKLQQESQKRRISIADLAKKIIESEELLSG